MAIRNPLYDLRAEPQTLPHGIPLVAALKGYADAGTVVELFTENLRGHLEARTIADFDADELLDFRSRRPIAQIESAHITDITTPSLQLQLLRDQADAPFYFLRGFEPDFRWPSFLADLLTLLDAIDVASVTWVHSIPMPVPHTRPIGAAVTGNRQEMIDQFGVWQPDTTVPASVLHVLEHHLADLGTPVTGFAMLTPHYLAETECPTTAVAATECVAVASGLALPTDELRDESQRFLTRLDEQIAENEELQGMVRGLEERHDDYLRREAPGVLRPEVPSADEIGAEFESFLARRQHPGEDTGDRPQLG
jgi:hypothetical protein